MNEDFASHGATPEMTEVIVKDGFDSRECHSTDLGAVVWSCGRVCGRVVVWSCGRVVMWSCGRVVVWSCGRRGIPGGEELGMVVHVLLWQLAWSTKPSN